jgi:transcriptional regulator with XRE-family HTH domain
LKREKGIMSDTATIDKKETFSLQSEEEFEKSQGITQAQYGRRRGVSRQMVLKYVANGMLTVGRGIISTSPTVRIDPEEADIELDEKLNPAFKKTEEGEKPNGNGLLYHNEKARKEKAQRMLLELDLKVKTGENINRKKAESAFSNKITAVVRRLQKISKRISPAVAKESDRIKCEEMIHNEIKEAVEEFGGNIHRRGAENAKGK